MPIQPKFTLPTGYESEQRKAERKRRLAEMLLQRGLSPSGNMQSWAQVLGSLGSAFAGNRLDRQADRMDEDVQGRMLNDYREQLGGFNADKATMTPDQLVEKYGSSAFLADEVKPFRDALARRLTEREDIIDFGGRRTRQGDVLGQIEPGRPTDAVIRDANGNWIVNPVRTTAALEAQGFTPNGAPPRATYSMPDPTAQPMPQIPSGMPPMSQAPGMPAPTGDGLNLQLLNPEEKQILAQELARRAGQGNGNYNLQNDTSIPMGSPLTARRAPAGVVNGKPYWIINGKPYDNPEGR